MIWAGIVSSISLRKIASGVRAFYLATAPDHFGAIAQKLAAHSLVTPASRIIVEKPIGKDGASAAFINDAIGAVFPEERIFRIDHYLGKETVQNLMALRFANALVRAFVEFRSYRSCRDHRRRNDRRREPGGYYENSGALRDMVQNHLLQLLCLVAMEPPASMRRGCGARRKTQSLKSRCVPIDAGNAEAFTVRGQYRAGASEGGAVKGYAEEVGNPADT